MLPQIKKIIGDFHITESSHEVIGVTEGMLGPILNKIVESNLPDSIYLKTHPRGHTSDNKPMLRVQIVSRGKDKSEVEVRYNNISRMMFALDLMEKPFPRMLVYYLSGLLLSLGKGLISFIDLCSIKTKINIEAITRHPEKPKQ
jgi:hypothetical protein